MKNTLKMNIACLPSATKETEDDIVDILTYALAVDDIVDSATDADITLFVVPGVLNAGSIWEGRCMEKGESRIPGIPHKYNPLIPESITAQDFDICDNILFFFPAELDALKETMPRNYALAAGFLELNAWLARYVDPDVDSDEDIARKMQSAERIDQYKANFLYNVRKHYKK